MSTIQLADSIFQNWGYSDTRPACFPEGGVATRHLQSGSYYEASVTHASDQDNIVFTQEGEDFFDGNPNLVQQIRRAIDDYDQAHIDYINEGLAELFGDDDHIVPQKKTELTIEQLGVGGQSRVFLIEIDGRKFVLKKPAPNKSAEQLSMKQSYLNEAAQLQKLSMLLSAEMKEMGIRFPKLYFLSRNLMCVEYIEGAKIRKSDNNSERVAQFIELMEHQISVNPYLRDTFIDVGISTATGEFTDVLIEPDGTIVFLDPVAPLPFP